MRILLTLALLLVAAPAFACSGAHETSAGSPMTTATGGDTSPETPPPPPATGG
jgi:hypothetical protein